jgi:acetylcholinesterase
LRFPKILESGGAALLSPFPPSRRQGDWDNFARAAGCGDTVRTGNSIACLQKANSSTILDGIISASVEAGEDYPWVPIIDGPNGVMPDIPSVLLKKGHFARLPFIAGTNLDEGEV